MENATLWHCGPSRGGSSSVVSRGTAERHVASILLLVDKEEEGTSSQWDLFDSCRELVSDSDVRVPGS